MHTRYHNRFNAVSASSMMKCFVIVLISLALTIGAESVFHTGKPVIVFLLTGLLGIALFMRKSHGGDSIQNIM